MPHSFLYFVLLQLYSTIFINFIIALFTFRCVGLGRDLDGFSLRFSPNRLLCFLLIFVLYSHEFNSTDYRKLVCYGSAASCNRRLFLRILGVKIQGRCCRWCLVLARDHFLTMRTCGQGGKALFMLPFITAVVQFMEVLSLIAGTPQKSLYSNSITLGVQH